MYSDIFDRIERTNKQIEMVSLELIDAEGVKYDKLSAKLEKLEERLERLQLWADDMELQLDYDE